MYVCVCVRVCVCVYLHIYARGCDMQIKKVNVWWGGSYICAFVHAERKFQLKRMVAFSPAVDACVS